MIPVHDDDAKAEPRPREVAFCPKMWKTSNGKVCLCALDIGHTGDCANREGHTSSSAKVMSGA